MKIKWLGHSSFLITTENGERIITDPFGKYDGLNYTPISEIADIMLVSHTHGDHFGGKVQGNPQMIDKIGSFTAQGIDFKGIPCHHDQSGGKERGSNLIFCFTIEGIRLCHLGDLGHLLSNQQIKEIGEVDILMIPVGGFYTIDAAEATQVCDQIKPRVIIPMHVSNDKCAFPIAGVDVFLSNKSYVEKVNASEKEFKQTELPLSTTITVLDHAL
ncbi:MAG: MBL fold metallo-hydrolase [Chloroflexota bacterium]|nr:MBL fold metallo-hydrolase [Chloroflexota bacterium]